MARKERNDTPPYYKNYVKYKPYLRREFNYSCVYCLIRETELGGKKSFHIDHYKPKSKFPELESTYTNLFYACRECNTSKGNYWPSRWDLLLGREILNPCDHDISLHLNCDCPEWKGISRAGKWHIQRLRLNSPALIKYRQDRNQCYKLLEELQCQRDEIKLQASQLVLPKETEKHTQLMQRVQEYDGFIDMMSRKIDYKQD